MSRFHILSDLSRQPFVRVLFVLWAASGAWDLALSEWIPEGYAKRLPRVYQVIAMTMGLLSWQIWIVAGALIFALACLEYAFRRTSVPDRPQPMTPAIPSQRTPPEMLPPKPPAAPESGKVDETRIFVTDSVTPSYLVNIFRDNMDIEATAQPNRFIGKWMKVNGVVRDIYTLGSNTVTVVLETDSDYSGDILRRGPVALFFHGHWIERILILTRGDKVSGIGKIDTINSMRLKLENCELKD